MTGGVTQVNSAIPRDDRRRCGGVDSEEDMMRDKFDLEYCQNNGVVAVRPTAHGRLAKLVKRTKAGHERVWVFRDTQEWRDMDGDERINVEARGSACGSYREAENFLRMCREVGLTVESGGFFVPFSNAHHRFGYDTEGGRFSTYLESEFKLVRIDLPTQAQIMEMISPKVVERRRGCGH